MDSLPVGLIIVFETDKKFKKGVITFGKSWGKSIGASMYIVSVEGETLDYFVKSEDIINVYTKEEYPELYI